MKTNRVLLETVIVTAITLLGMWFVPAAKTLFALLPVSIVAVDISLIIVDSILYGIIYARGGNLIVTSRIYWAIFLACW